LVLEEYRNQIIASFGRYRHYFEKRLQKMNKKRLEEWLRVINEGIINDTIDIPDNAILTLPESTSIFTRRRLELIEIIKQKQPQSVQELARITKRAKQAVTRDLKILERFEIVKLKKRGRISLPLVEREIVVLAIPYINRALLERKMAFGEVS